MDTLEYELEKLKEICKQKLEHLLHLEDQELLKTLNFCHSTNDDWLNKLENMSIVE
jgi:succinate dehydrogenase flavin-adding protein (antitoxin of CptAB toxin-antitoxin module)